MNNIHFSCCKINTITEQGKYNILSCSTKVPTEKGALFNATVFVYVEKDLFQKICSEQRTNQMISVGNNIAVTGKTVCNINGTNIVFNLLLQTTRRLDFAKKTFEANVKLFDVNIDTLTTFDNPVTQRVEAVVKYYNNEQKTKDTERTIIASIPANKKNVLQEKSAYNCSGPLVIRQANQRLIPIIITNIFIKDLELSSDMLDIKM